MTQPNNILVDRIVAAVMARLAGEATSQSAPVATQGVLGLTDAVITADVLATRLNGHGKAVISPKSIVTPAAVDWLRERNIDWSRGVADAASPQKSANWRTIVALSTPGVEAVLSSTDWPRDLAGCWKEAAERATASICRAEADGIVVFTRAAVAVACQANRNERIRAAVVQSVGCVESARRSMGANVLVIDPRKKSFIELRNILRAFTTAASPKLPADWSN
jgi:hypothetical protein